MLWESMIARASYGITSQFINQNKSGQKRHLNLNSQAVPWSASSRERGRHCRLFIPRRKTEYGSASFLMAGLSRLGLWHSSLASSGSSAL